MMVREPGKQSRQIDVDSKVLGARSDAYGIRGDPILNRRVSLLTSDSGLEVGIKLRTRRCGTASLPVLRCAAPTTSDFYNSDFCGIGKQCGVFREESVEKASYRPLRTYRTPLATLHSTIRESRRASINLLAGLSASLFRSWRTCGTRESSTLRIEERIVVSLASVLVCIVGRYQTEAVIRLGGSTVRIKTPRIQGTI
jgi:hypothetical protein